MRRIIAVTMLLAGAITSISHASQAGDLKFVAGNIPPYAFEKDGKPDGVEVAIIRAIAAENKLPFQIEFQPWQRAQTTTQEGQDFGIIPLSRTAEREPHYKWVGPLLTDVESLVTISSNKKAPATLDEAKSWPVCVLRASPAEAILKAKGFTNLFSSTDTATCVRMLFAGNVDAWSVAGMVGPYEYRLAAHDPATLSTGAAVSTNNHYLGLSQNVSDDIVARLQHTVEELQANGKIAALVNSFK